MGRRRHPDQVELGGGASASARSRSAPGRAPGWGARLTLLGPGVVYWVALFAVPVGILLLYSVYERGPYGGVVTTFTTENYRRLLDPLYLKVFWTSLRLAAIATGVSLLIGFPSAYMIASAPKRWRTALLVLVILPFWTSFLIRTYAWIVLLNPKGVINELLVGLGFGPLPLLYNGFAVVVGLVYAYIPLMVLPIYASLERLGPTPREAAADLYAGPWGTFRKVLWPLSLPGVVAGCIFVFVPSLGNFIVPDLLGGGQLAMIGTLIQQQFLQARDWPFGSAIAVTVILLMLLLLWGQATVLRRERGTERAR